MIILKVTEKPEFTLCLEDTFFEKPQGGGGGGQITTPTRQLQHRFRVKVRTNH